MFIEAPGERICTCWSKATNGELTDRTYDDDIARQSWREEIKMMEVEDFESRSPKEVTLLVETDKEIQDLPELKMPKALPGNSGGKSL